MDAHVQTSKMSAKIAEVDVATADVAEANCPLKLFSLISEDAHCDI